MLIDDEPAQSRLITALASREGWRTLVVKDSETAIATLGTRQGMQLGAIVLDQWVPGDEACTLIAELRARRPMIPILMLTTSASPLLAVEAMRAGATDYLVKPVSRNVLVSRLNRLINQHERELESERLFSLYEKLVHDQNDMIAELNLDLSIRFANKPFVNLFKGDYSVMGNFLDVVSFSDRKHVEAALSVLEHGLKLQLLL